MKCKPPTQKKLSALKTLKPNAKRAALFLKGLANSHRLLILCHLAEGEHSVTALIKATGIPQTSMSQHLAKLKRAHIVTFRREHRILYYTLVPGPVTTIMNTLHTNFCPAQPTT